MKKQIGVIFLSIFLLLVVFAGNTLAQDQQRVQDPSLHDTDTYVPGEAGDQVRDALQDGTAAGIPQAVGQGLKGVSQNLNRISARVNNPEVGEQIRTMAEKHEQLQTKTQTALNKIEDRPAYLKFLIGPDYKNAGQLRSDVVGIRNDIRQLNSLKDRVDPENVAEIEGAIAELALEANSLEAQVEDSLLGFSLFGWLGKLLSE